MSIFDTFIVKRQSLSDFCDHRANMARLIAEHYEHFKMIDAEMHKFYQYGMPRAVSPHDNFEVAIKDLDRMYWRQSFEHTGLMQLLDAQSRKKFDDSLQHNPPEFTLANVQSSFLELAQKADTMFADGVVNVFKRLKHEYARHDSFKVTERVIMSWMVEPSYKRGMQLRYGMSTDKINDIDRVFKVLDGKKHNARELSCAMNAGFENCGFFEDEYFTAKPYKNGNLHITFKRADLLDKVNQLIAKQLGATIGARDND